MTRRYMLDTGPAFDLLFKRRGVNDRVKLLRAAGVKIGVGLPTVGEIIAGLEGSGDRDHFWEIAHRTLGQLKFWPFDEKAAYQYGLVFTDLKPRGRIIQQVDMQLAAIAMTLPQCTLATYDTDFAVIPGLACENWLA